MLLAVGAEFQSAATEQKSGHEKQASGVDVEIEVSHFAAAAAKEQHKEQNPSAVAAAKNAAVVVAAAAAAVIEQSVEHSFTSVSILTIQSISIYEVCRFLVTTTTVGIIYIVDLLQKI